MSPGKKIRDLYTTIMSNIRNTDETTKESPEANHTSTQLLDQLEAMVIRGHPKKKNGPKDLSDIQATRALTANTLKHCDQAT